MTDKFADLKAASGLSMAIQDYMGQERFIAYMRDFWIPLHWSVGATAFVVAVVLLRDILKMKCLEAA